MVEDKNISHWLENDGRQWVLYREQDAKSKDGVPSRSTTIVGYFPRLHQALGKLYEATVIEAVAKIDPDTMLEAVERAEKLFQAMPDMAATLLPDRTTVVEEAHG